MNPETNRNVVFLKEKCNYITLLLQEIWFKISHISLFLLLMIKWPCFKVKFYISFLEGKKTSYFLDKIRKFRPQCQEKKGTYLDIAQERDKKMTPFLWLMDNLMWAIIQKVNNVCLLELTLVLHLSFVLMLCIEKKHCVI